MANNLILRFVLTMASSLFLISSAFAQNVFAPLIIDLDTISSEWIKNEYFKKDSVIVLEYNSIDDDYSDETYHRVVYVDFRKNTVSSLTNKYSNQLSEILNGESYLKIQQTKKSSNKISPLIDIKNTYLQIHRINGQYVLFEPNFDHLTILSDSAYMYKDDEGLLCRYYDDIEVKNGFYEITLNDFQNSIRTLIIKDYDSIGKVQIRREKHFVGTKEYVNDRLYIPLSEAINYPVLRITNTLGLDDLYDHFERVEFEK